MLRVLGLGLSLKGLVRLTTGASGLRGSQRCFVEIGRVRGLRP